MSPAILRTAALRSTGEVDRRHRRTLRRAVRTAALVLLVALVAAWAVALRPAVLGGPATYVVVRGTSMLPVDRSGDLVVVRRQVHYEPGEIVAYRVPRGEPGAGILVIHEIVGGDPVHGFVLKGVNNPTPDPWTVPSSDVVGAQWLRILFGGTVVRFLRSVLFLALALAGLTYAATLRWLAEG